MEIKRPDLDPATVLAIAVFHAALNNLGLSQPKIFRSRGGNGPGTLVVSFHGFFRSGQAYKGYCEMEQTPNSELLKPTMVALAGKIAKCKFKNDDDGPLEFEWIH